MMKKNDLSDVARQMMNGVVQIQVEGSVEEDIQSVMYPSIKIQGVWLGSGRKGHVRRCRVWEV